MIKIYTFKEFKFHTLIIKTVEKKYMDKNCVSKSEIVIEDNYIDIIKKYFNNLGFKEYSQECQTEFDYIDSLLSHSITHDWYRNKIITFYYFKQNNYLMHCYDLYSMPEERYFHDAYHKYLDKFAWEKKEKG